MTYSVGAGANGLWIGGDVCCLGAFALRPAVVGGVSWARFLLVLLELASVLGVPGVR